MNITSSSGELIAVLIDSNSLAEGSIWYGNPIESLQAARMKYPKGKSFKVHRHILNPRIIKRTQEAFIVIQGKIAVELYDKRDQCITKLEAGPGDAILVFREGHGVKVVEDAIFYEIKAGQFSYVSEDKE